MRRTMFIPGLAAAATAMGLGLSNAPIVMGGGALCPKGPKIPYAEFLKRRRREGGKYKLTRKQKVRMARSAERRAEHDRGLLANMQRKMFNRSATAAAFNAVINKMTNWQRNQWSKKGYPGLRKHEIELVQPFLEMERSNGRA